MFGDTDPLMQAVAEQIEQLSPADLAHFAHALIKLRVATADGDAVEMVATPPETVESPEPPIGAPSVAMPSSSRADKRVVSDLHSVMPLAATPPVEQPGDKPANTDRKRRHPLRTGLIATTAVASALAAGLVVAGRHGGDPLPEAVGYSCSDTTHRPVVVGPNADGPLNLLPKVAADEIQRTLSGLGLVNMHETWSSIATALSDKFGYHISGERLAAANPTAYALGSNLPLEQTKIDGNGHVSDSIGPDGTFCYNIPGPIVAGQIETDGTNSLAAYAKQYGITTEALRKLNAPILIDDNTPIDPGFVLWTSEPNTKLVLRKMTEKTPRDAAGGDPKLMAAITEANAAVIGSGQALNEGDMLYLPYPKQAAEPVDKVVQAHQGDYQAGHENLPPPPPKKPEPIASNSPSASPSGPESHSDSANPPALTAHQQEIIDNLPGLTKEQRVNLAQFVVTIMQLEQDGKMTGINVEVMLGQAIDESSWGRDDLATQFHNYFGMKAGSDWHGSVASDIGTHEYASGAPSAYATTAPFRAYKDMMSGFQGYVDKINQSSWYADARQAAIDHPDDPGAYLDGLLNKPAWATDPNYKATILGIIKDAQLTELLAVKPGPKSETSTPGNIKLQPDKYPANQRYLPGNKSNGAIVTLPDGSKVLSRDLSYDQRVQAIQTQLNRVQLSAQDYQTFVGNIQDDTARVKAKYPSFNGSQNGLGTPKPSDLKYFVLHFTATDTSGVNLDGLGFANSMAQEDLGVQFYINAPGNAYHLTDDRAAHVLGYNPVAEGVEIAATEQTAINSDEYTSAIYLTANWLISMGYITKDTPSAGAVVDAMVRGHRELNPDGHEDNPQMVMDPIRGMIKQLLVQLGYKA